MTKSGKKGEKVVLAYSGGLDTSVILPWLKETYGYEVIAFAAELGQGDELAGIKRKALASGAVKCVVKDLRKEFVADFLWPMLKSGAVYENGYLLGTSIARPLIAKHQVDVAHAEGATAVAHGATGKGNDQVRFELTYMALNPSLKIIAPWKDPNFALTSREAAIDYAKKHGIPIEQSKKKIYSRDRNIWHLSHEGADLEDPANEPKDDLFVISRPVSKTPDKPDYVTIGFHEGVPIKLDGKLTSSVKIIEMLNQLGGKHGNYLASPFDALTGFEYFKRQTPHTVLRVLRDKSARSARGPAVLVVEPGFHARLLRLVDAGVYAFEPFIG